MEGESDEAVPMTRAATWTSSQMVRYGPSPDGLFFWTGKFSQLKFYFSSTSFNLEANPSSNYYNEKLGTILHILEDETDPLQRALREWARE